MLQNGWLTSSNFTVLTSEKANRSISLHWDILFLSVKNIASTVFAIQARYPRHSWTIAPGGPLFFPCLVGNYECGQLSFLEKAYQLLQHCSSANLQHVCGYCFVPSVKSWLWPFRHVQVCLSCVGRTLVSCGSQFGFLFVLAHSMLLQICSKADQSFKAREWKF